MSAAVLPEGAVVLSAISTSSSRGRRARARADEFDGVPIFGELAPEDGIASVGRQAIAAAPELHVLVRNAAMNPRGTSCSTRSSAGSSRRSCM